MIATKILIHRSAPVFTKNILARQGRLIGSQVLKSPGKTSTIRAFSSLDPNAAIVEPSSITKKVRVLNIDVVKNILNELNTVDTNHDGR